MVYKFESHFDLNDEVPKRQRSGSTTEPEMLQIKGIYFHITNNYDDKPLQFVRYYAGDGKSEPSPYFAMSEHLESKNFKKFEFDSEYVINQRVWVLKQDEDDVYVYHVKEAHITHIEWIFDRVEDFKDLRYSAKIDNDDDSIEYFKGTAFAEGKHPFINYIYNTEEDAKSDQELYVRRYEEIKARGGFY